MTLIQSKCKYCKSVVYKNSTNGKTLDTEPVCSRKSCKKWRKEHDI